MSKLVIFLGLVSAAWVSSQSSGNAQKSITNDAVTHYAYCVTEARDHNFFRDNVIDADRYIIYRCHGPVAISYFNYLGRMKTPEIVVEDFTGTFVFRAIVGIGKCWHKLTDADGRLVSEYGCDIHDEI